MDTDGDGNLCIFARPRLILGRICCGVGAPPVAVWLHLQCDASYELRVGMLVCRETCTARCTVMVLRASMSSRPSLGFLRRRSQVDCSQTATRQRGLPLRQSQGHEGQGEPLNSHESKSCRRWTVLLLGLSEFQVNYETRTFRRVRMHVSQGKHHSYDEAHAGHSKNV